MHFPQLNRLTDGGSFSEINILLVEFSHSKGKQLCGIRAFCTGWRDMQPCFWKDLELTQPRALLHSLFSQLSAPLLFKLIFSSTPSSFPMFVDQLTTDSNAPTPQAIHQLYQYLSSISLEHTSARLGQNSHRPNLISFCAHQTPCS